MRKQTLLTVLAATMLVLAGCSGGTLGDSGASADDGTTDGEDSTDGMTDDDSSTGTVMFYVSDEPGQIDDFRHLNVTIDRIGFERGNGESNTTATATTTTTATATNTTNTTATATNASETEEREADDADAAGGGVVTRDVDDRSVDLTKLKGANATLIGTPEIPAGNYTKVTVYISDVNATLQDGSTANVKLPSNTLKLTKGFSLEANGTVQFVYDISVFKAGNSGKYILKPVISESGPDQDVNDVDAADDDEQDDDEQDDDEQDDDEQDDDTIADNETEDNGGPPDGSEN